MGVRVYDAVVKNMASHAPLRAKTVKDLRAITVNHRSRIMRNSTLMLSSLDYYLREAMKQEMDE